MKVFWFDTETTGLNPDRNTIHELSCIVEIDDEVVEERTLRCRPSQDEVVDKAALEVSGVTLEQIETYPERDLFLGDLLMLLDRWVDRYSKDRASKFCFGGYNVRYDVDMLFGLARRAGHQFLGARFNGVARDPYPLVMWMQSCGRYPVGRGEAQLARVCERFGVPLGSSAHDSMADVRAARDLAKNLDVLDLRCRRDADASAVVGDPRGTSAPQP